MISASDLHQQMILEAYREALPVLEQLKTDVLVTLHEALDDSRLFLTAIEARVKKEKSLAGKLVLKGTKYASLTDITDLVGARVITSYTDDVDRIASIAERLFEIDWENSVDKRRLHQLDSFGYNSLHYICRLPGYDFRFELQLRTTLQHAWAVINHDNGYKSDIEIPQEYLRRMNRLAGMLEMADDEFSRIRTELTDYRRRVQTLVKNGKLDDVQLDGDAFRQLSASAQVARLQYAGRRKPTHQTLRRRCLSAGTTPTGEHRPRHHLLRLRAAEYLHRMHPLHRRREEWAGTTLRHAQRHDCTKCNTCRHHI